MSRACCVTKQIITQYQPGFLITSPKYFLGLVLSALLIKDQHSEENSKTYLTMLSLTIARLQGIIPKLMALQRRWFRHARKDFEKFVSLRTKRIRTWPYLTSPWVTGCLNTPLCLISLLIFYFLGDIPFHPLPLLFKWTRLWIWTPQPFRLGSSQKGLLYLGRLCPWPWRNFSTASKHLMVCTHMRW